MSGGAQVDADFKQASLRHEPGFAVEATEARCFLVVLVNET